MKTKHEVTLVGFESEGIPSNTQDKSLFFEDQNCSFRVEPKSSTKIILCTKKGSYTLIKHPILNYFYATCNDVKVQVTIQASVAKLRYWS